MNSYEIEKVIVALVDQWISHGMLRDPQSINEGPCSEFADDAEQALQAAFPGIDVEILNEEDVLSVEGLIMPNYYHTFMRIGGAYYDAEAPHGVSDWRGLPFFRRHGHNIVEDNAPGMG